MKTVRITNAYEGNKRIEAFDNGYPILDIIINDYNVDGALYVLKALNYIVTRREF